MSLFKFLRNLAAIAFVVFLVWSLARGAAVAAAIAFVVYVAWLPIRDRIHSTSRAASWRRATTPDPRGRRYNGRTGGLN